MSNYRIEGRRSESSCFVPWAFLLHWSGYSVRGIREKKQEKAKKRYSLLFSSLPTCSCVLVDDKADDRSAFLFIKPGRQFRE